jgi:hypothetical protein
VLGQIFVRQGSAPVANTKPSASERVAISAQINNQYVHRAVHRLGHLVQNTLPPPMKDGAIKLLQISDTHELA